MRSPDPGASHSFYNFAIQVCYYSYLKSVTLFLSSDISTVLLVALTVVSETQKILTWLPASICSEENAARVAEWSFSNKTNNSGDWL